MPKFTAPLSQLFLIAHSFSVLLPETILSFYVYIGVPKFILISVHDYNLPPFLLTSGYFTGKRKAESEVLAKYPTSGRVAASFISSKL